MFRKFTACAAALTLAFTPSVLANAEEKAMKVSINGQETSLSFNDTEGNEDEKQILGDAWYYGIVADTFHFNGESETNFAVKSLVHQNGTGGQTGVTDKGQGSQKAFFMAGSVDNPFMIKGIDAEVVTPESEKDKFQNSCNTGNPITFTDEDAEDINAYVDALEDGVGNQSQRLASLDSFGDESQLQNSGKITLDVTQAGNSTVYLNVDKWPELLTQFQQSSGVNLVKNAGQKVVFNFVNDKSVVLQKMTVTVNGTAEDTAGLANHSTTAGSSMAEDLIFNMPVAKTVVLNDSTGIFLAPQAEVTSYGVDGGWLVADTFTNNCEWHFINGSLPAEITERKTVITPKREGSVLGAKRARPSTTPQTDEKPSATPEAAVTPSSVPETTPSSSKPEEKPSETPATTPVPAPSATPETTPAPSVKPQTEEKPSATPETTVKPSSTPETTPSPATTPSSSGKEETPSTPSVPASAKPVSTPESTEKTETTTSVKPVEKKNERAEKENRKQVRMPEKNENVKPDQVITGNGNVRNAVPVHEGTGTMTRSETPDTGDHSHLTIYSVLFFGAGVLMIGLIRRMRNEEE